MQNPIDEKISLIHEDSMQLKKEVASFAVVDDSTQRMAVEILSRIKKRLKRIEDLRKEFVQPLNDQVKKINNMFKIEAEPLALLEEGIKIKVRDYMLEQQRKAEAEAERLRKEQEAREAEEKKKIEAARKAEEEAKAKLEAARREAEAAKTKKAREEAERKAAEAAAQAEQEAAKAEAAEEKLENTEVAVVEQAPTTVRTAKGTFSLKKVWTWDVENEEVLRRAHPELFVLDVKAVNKLVQSGTRTIAGLRIYQTAETAMKT